MISSGITTYFFVCAIVSFFSFLISSGMSYPLSILARSIFYEKGWIFSMMGYVAMSENGLTTYFIFGSVACAIVNFVLQTLFLMLISSILCVVIRKSETKQ